MQFQCKYRRLGQRIKLNLQNYNAGEVKITFPELFFIEKQVYFFTFFAAKKVKKAVSIRAVQTTS